MMPHPKALAEYLDQTVLDCGGWGSGATIVQVS